MGSQPPERKDYRVLRRIRRDQLAYIQFPGIPQQGRYSDWHRFGTRAAMELAVAEKLADCLRRLAVDQSYQYAVFDADGRMVQDEFGIWTDMPAVASVA